MYETSLTGQQAKQARNALNLSQGKVAGSLDINRTYLSQFENGRYLLDDAMLEKLRSYYEEQGFAFKVKEFSLIGEEEEGDLEHEFEEDGGTERPRVMDGFVVPPQVDEAEADGALSEYDKNTRRIQELCAQHIKRGLLFVDEDDRDEKAQQVLVLMARNYTIIEELHGHETVFPCRSENQNTIGEHISQVFADHLGIGT